MAYYQIDFIFITYLYNILLNVHTVLIIFTRNWHLICMIYVSTILAMKKSRLQRLGEKICSENLIWINI